ncbi:peroxiredoxin [Muriicola sp.]|uniref:peroxiredoxin n=1 Tax=Muriicola sp. TaxID=2020856 RepID=UPI0035671B48
MGLKKGDRIPDFSLTDQDGNTFHSSDLIGKKPLVIFFYPRDNTPGCTKEACSFRDSYQEFTERGAEVIGISADTETSHRKFATMYNLPFILLSDPKNKVRRLFKVEKSLFNLLPGRETFVVDKEGFVVMSFNNMGASGHMSRALKAIKSIS